MRTLLIAAVNTRLKWGVLEDGEIHETGHILQSDLSEAGIATITTRLPRDIGGALISNVAGQSLATRLTGILTADYDCDVRFARTAAEACGVVNAYADPRQMGVDRWVAMLGAWGEFGQSTVVVDAGTAVTIDVLDDDGQHLGGQILPGFALMASALSNETSDIPAVDTDAWSIPRSLELFGNTTAACVTDGAVNAVCGAIERAISVLRSNAYDPVVVLTGGDASAILHALETEPLHRPNLVLAGLARLLEHER